MAQYFATLFIVLASAILATAVRDSTMTTKYGTPIEDTASEAMEFYNSIGVKPTAFTEFGTPLVDDNLVNKKLIESRRRCTSGPCCDLTTGFLKTYGAACTPPANQPCKRVAGVCLGGSTDCRLQNKEDGSICNGSGKCTKGKCIIETCEEGCCDADKSPLAQGTLCRGGKCDFGKCVPNFVSVISIDTTPNSFVQRETPPLVVIQTPAPKDESDAAPVPVMAPALPGTLSDIDRRVLSRVDGVLGKYNERKNENLKLVLHGITEKARRRQAELERVSKQTEKKEKAWKEEVEQAKKEREELEKADKVNW